jgi:PAS domain S-box-containing protein
VIFLHGSLTDAGESVDAPVGPTPPSDKIDPSLLQAWTDVLEHLPDAVFIVAGGDDGGRILYVNPRAMRMFGYAPGELIGQPIDVLVPRQLAEQHVRDRRAYIQAPQLRTMGAGLELRGRRRDGNEFPIDVLLNPNGDGPLAATIAIVRDMTERKLLEDALTQARDSAVRANEVKSRFLAAASHDLRQPLQTIWSLQAVLSRALKDTDFGPHLELLEEAVRNMDQILSSLIDINRLEKGAIQPVVRDFPLHEILPRLRSEFGYAASSKSLALEIEDSPEFARSDPMLLPVILRNLLGNAIKYTQHGTVRLHVRAATTWLYMDVTDTGPGIPAEHLQRLFDAFYQVDNPNRDQCQGVGLGLSIVQTICRLLDHEISIESRVGEGSTFTVRVPRGLVTDHLPDPVPVALPPPLARSNQVTLMHIEDDPGVAKSMAFLLRLEGYDVVSAASRDEALQHVTVHGVRPALILCDYQLPMGFTGVEIVAEIATLLKGKPPTIMLTGDIAEDHVESARVVADRILPKPVDISLLLHEIDTLLAKSD